MKDFLIGFGYPWRGLGVLFQPRLRALAWWPIVINAVLFSVAFYFLVIEVNNWISDLLPGWLAWLEWLLLPLFMLIALAATLFSFARIANLIAVPFNARLCRALMRMKPDDPLTQAAEKQTWRNDFRLVGHEVLKLAVYLAWFLPLLAMSFIPFIGFLAQIVLLYYGIYWCALEYLDYPLSEAGTPMRQIRTRLREQRFLTLGFGAGQLLLSLTPVFNLMSVPAGVVAATRLCQQNPLNSTASG